MTASHLMMYRPRQLEWLGRVPFSRTRFYEAGATILEEKDGPRTAVMLVVSGTVRLLVQWSDGREHVLLYLPKDSIFGELAALGVPIETGLTAIADSECVIGEIYVPDMLEAASNDPSIFLDLMKLTSEKTTLFLRELSRSVFGTALMQVACVLSTLSYNSNVIAVSQERLATITGKTRMTVSSQLHYLQAIGAIRLERTRIVVTDAEILARHAEGGTE